MHYDKFDICEAYYLFFSNYHEGQFSDKYKRLCKLSKYFTPGKLLNFDSLTDNGKHIYDNLISTYED